MYKDPKFPTIITIEKTSLSNFICSIFINFLTPTRSSEDKEYNLLVEDLDTGIFDAATDHHYWIDKRPATDSQSTSSFVSINRNKTIVSKINLAYGRVSNNRFYKRIRFHLKEYQFGGITDKSVWISDELVLVSREVLIPDIIHKGTTLTKDGNYRCSFSLSHKTAKDQSIYVNYLEPVVSFYDKGQLVCVGTANNEGDDELVFTSPGTHGSKVTRVDIELKYYNGETAVKKTFTTDVVDKQTFFIATEDSIEKGMNAALSYQANTGYLWKIIKIYQKP